jgi:putative ABC transport system ATP-binding protein
MTPENASYEIVLRADRLGRTVGSSILLRDLSFSLRRGENFAIFGPSGAGKSSLLRLLNRLDEPTEGTVFLEGIDYRKIPPRELRRRVGMVTQRAFLFPGTVGDNVSFGPRQRGETPSAERIAHLLIDVGLSGYAGRDVANLSGGEAQRVALARALANEPSVLLLDEPTSALDENAKQAVESLILRVVRQSRLTCVIVTHDARQAGRFADRVLLMERGSVKQIGSTREVLGAQTSGR